TCVECVTTPNCSDPTRPVCNAGNVCGCASNTDCGGAAGKPICDTAANNGSGVCVVCTATQGCSGDTPFCFNDSQCLCRDNSDCPVGKACVGSPGSCQPVDSSGAQNGIIQFLDAGVGATSILIDGAYITYFKPAIGTTNSDPPGFFMQAQASGPGMYVAVDPVTVSADGGSLSVGDRVQLTVTSKFLVGSTTVPAANGITGVSVLSTNHPVQHLDTDTPAGLVVDVSNANDVVSNIPAYLSRVVKMAGFIDGGFVSSGTDHFQADFPTAGVPAVPVPRLRLPTNVLDALDIGQGCRVTLKVGPFWRFTTTAQPTSYSQGDVQVISCSFAPAVLYAFALSDTSVEVTFDHKIDPASVDAADFNIPGLVVLTAIGNGRKIMLGTTPQVEATRYTVTATGMTGLGGVPISTTANKADFTGYGPPPSGLVINEIDYDNPGTDNFEYIELYNGSANPVDLGALDLVLVNGLDTSTIAHREYSRFHLIGTVDDAGVPANLLQAGGYMVFGRGDGGTLTLLAPVPDSALRMSFPNTDTIQNGFADGVGILHYASGQLLDSVVYEPIATTEQTTFTVATGVGDRTYNFAEGNAPTTASDITSDAGVIAREPNGTDTGNNNADFQFVIPYTPGSANP
ncbi:MAG TPA: lamin tail domain-containing protein, partial [Myxococcaceae bacterium]|nr:lamin tail domain-containing protein [Myxococcaceae bacterium]